MPRTGGTSHLRVTFVSKQSLVGDYFKFLGPSLIKIFLFSTSTFMALDKSWVENKDHYIHAMSMKMTDGNSVGIIHCNEEKLKVYSPNEQHDVHIKKPLMIDETKTLEDHSKGIRDVLKAGDANSLFRLIRND